MDTRPNPLGPLLVIFLTVAIFAGGEYAPVPLDWYVRLLGFLVAIWAVVVTWQWAYGDWVDTYARYRQAAAITPANETAKSFNGLGSEALALLGHLHVLKVAIVPGHEPEIIISGTTLTLEQFLFYLDACDNYRLISIRDYSDRVNFPNRSGATQFVQYCVSRGWAVPAKDVAQNDAAHWLVGWDKWQVRAQFGTLLEPDSRAQDAQGEVDSSGGALE